MRALIGNFHNIKSYHSILNVIDFKWTLEEGSGYIVVRPCLFACPSVLYILRFSSGLHKTLISKLVDYFSADLGSP